VSNAVGQALATNGDTATFGAGALLYTVNVTKATTSAVVTVYNGTSTSGQVMATIDASVKGSYSFWDMRFPLGIFAKLTGANANVTIVAE
jgi:hypothetical protein